MADSLKPEELQEFFKPQYWFCHDCGKDQTTQIEHEVSVVSASSVEERAARLAPRVSIKFSRFCSICGGTRLGILLTGVIKV